MSDVKKSNYNTYLIEGELYVSISTILNMESAGDFLIKWALKEFSKEPDPIAAHQAYMENVAGIGTAIHKYIEQDLAGKEGVANEKTIAAIEAYHQWRNEHDVEVLASEKVLHHREWRCAGCVDAVLRIDGKLYVADFKTGQFKPRYFSQLAAYWAMLRDEPKRSRIAGIEDAELAVVEILRDGSPVKLITLESKYQGAITREDELANFNCLRHLWYFRNLRSRNFQPIIKEMGQLLDPMDIKFRETFHLKAKAQNK